MKALLALCAACLLSGCGACYQDSKNSDGSWPSYCADRFDSPNPTKRR